MKRIGLYVLFLALLFFAAPLEALSSDMKEQLDSARIAYDRKDHEKALKLYQEIAKEHPTPSLLYNMGNAALRANDLGKAILYFQRAREKAPWDPDIQHNLSVARSRTRDDFNDRISGGFYAAFKDFLVASPLGSWWTWSMVCSCLSALSFFLIARFPKGQRTMGWSSMFFFLFLTALFYGAHFGSRKVLEKKDRAVVLAPSVQVRSAPRTSSSTTFVLHEGTTLEVREIKEEWTEVRTPDDQVGWIRRKELGRF